MSSDQEFDRHDELLAVFAEGPVPAEPRTTAEIAAQLEVDRETVQTQLEGLVDRGELRTKSVGEAGRIWWLPEASPTAPSDDDTGKPTPHLRAVLDTIESAVFMKDTDGSYLLMNQACRELFDVSQEAELSELTAADLFDPETAATVRANDRRVFEEGSTITVEEEIPSSQGVRPHLTRKTPLFDENGEVDALCAVSTDISEQKARETQLKQQRTDLVALNNLNRVFREIIDAVLEQPTRAEIEETLCEQLAGSESYIAAHLGDIEPTTEDVTIRAQDGPEMLADILDLSTPLAYPITQCPVWVALRTGTQTVVEDVTSDPLFEAWTDELTASGVESFAAVPVGHESSQYGVLGLFTSRTDAFGPHEQAVLGQLGEVVGHAIATSERQRALLSDETIELSFRVEDVLDQFNISFTLDGRVTYTRSVPVGDGGYLIYGTATGDGMELLERLVESDGNHCKSATALGDTESGTRFQLRVSDHPVLSAARQQAGRVHEIVLEDGDFDLTFHYGPSADIQQAINGVKAAYPDATLITRTRTVRPGEQSHITIEALSERLTERQLAALEAAYGAGFFNWPRDCSGEELADSLGISPSTYHQHLRKAQQTLMHLVFENGLG